MALSETDWKFIDELGDPVIKGVIMSLDNAIDEMHEAVIELSNKIDKLEQRLDNV